MSELSRSIIDKICQIQDVTARVALRAILVELIAHIDAEIDASFTGGVTGEINTTTTPKLTVVNGLITGSSA
jgi:hypothetical protein